MNKSMIMSYWGIIRAVHPSQGSAKPLFYKPHSTPNGAGKNKGHNG